MTEPETIYDSDDLDDAELGGFEVSVARDETGNITHVLLLDHERMEMMECPAEVALAIAQAIIAQVRPPGAALH